ncbi:MAG: HipA family kinase [Leptolyngbyaceae cyanobacterium]
MDGSLPTYKALRVVSAEVCGSSRPVVIETDAGYFFTKLRGAAQGTSALVAEIIVAKLAEALGLWVPAQALISIDTEIHSENREDEFLDLLAASSGINLGFQYLHGARDIRSHEIKSIDGDFASQVLWLDSLVMNVDRTAKNPNLMFCQDKIWLIDHGAALPFQYRWATVVEESPRNASYGMHQHIFWHRAHSLERWDDSLAASLSATVLQEAVNKIPSCFLQPLLSSAPSAQKIERRRQAYAAFLWKRLKPPRPFVNMGLVDNAYVDRR